MRRRALFLFAVVLLLAAAALLLPVKESLRAALGWMASHRESSGLAFIGLYVLATVCLVPGILLTLAAGAIFGLVRGVVLVSVASVLGASAAFFVGRTLARGWTERRIAAWPKFRALDGALAARGFWIVLLTRLSPLFPFNLLNYAYGATAVRPRDYITGSWLGMLPATVLYVYAGSAAASLAQALAGGALAGRTAALLFLVLGLAATVAVAVLVTRLARAQLDRERARDPRRRGDAPHSPRRDRHRRASARSTASGARRNRAAHQRDGLRSRRAAAASCGARCGPGRLRAGAGFRAARDRGRAARARAADPAAGGARGGGARGGCPLAGRREAAPRRARRFRWPRRCRQDAAARGRHAGRCG